MFCEGRGAQSCCPTCGASHCGLCLQGCMSTQHAAWAAQRVIHVALNLRMHTHTILTADLRQTPCGRRAPQAPPWTCASSSSAARRRWPRSGACWSMCAPAHLRCAPAGKSLLIPAPAKGYSRALPQGKTRCASMLYPSRGATTGDFFAVSETDWTWPVRTCNTLPTPELLAHEEKQAPAL